MLRFVQRSGQSAFQVADALFNRVFGERLNPLYYLGSISYWLFWVVVASGFYLYAFCDTGVNTTWQSVQSLTVKQWFAGGILRSVHRYASDAMVLTMLLHLVRHFVFDRYRSFRAFSWITGVVLLWFAYASGINGFMLPWDRLAQYVTTATAEWLDALPVFRGALVRNFVLPENISDRFFSLLLLWSPIAVWVLVVGVILLFLLLPWLPPARFRAGHSVRAIFYPMNRAVMVRDGETLLDAGLREGQGADVPCHCSGRGGGRTRSCRCAS